MKEKRDELVLTGLQLINRALGTAVTKEQAQKIMDSSFSAFSEGDDIKLEDIFYHWLSYGSPRSRQEAAYFGYLFGFLVGAIAERAGRIESFHQKGGPI